MNDWIYRYMGVFWAVCVTVGTIVGALTLRHDFGVVGGVALGALGGAGAALMLSISRYIAAGDD